MSFITQDKTNLKYILIVVIAAAIVGGGILAWQYYQGPGEEAKTPEETLQKETAKDKTADWNIYKNIEYGYQFKYPAALELEGHNHDGIPVERAPRILLGFPEEKTPQVGKIITIEVRNKLEEEMIGESAGSFLRLSYIEELNKGECKIETEESAFARISCEDETGTIRLISSVFEVDNKFYVIGLSMMSAVLDEKSKTSTPSLKALSEMDLSYELEVYNQILSTFSVLE